MSGMEFEAVDNLVDGFALGPKAQADQVEIGTGDGLDGRPVGGIVAGCEHLLGIDRGRYLARDGPLEGPGQSRTIAAVDEDRFADQGVVVRTRGILVALANA